MGGVRLEFEFGKNCSRSSRTIVDLLEKFANCSRTEACNTQTEHILVIKPHFVCYKKELYSHKNVTHRNDLLSRIVTIMCVTINKYILLSLLIIILFNNLFLRK